MNWFNLRLIISLLAIVVPSIAIFPSLAAQAQAFEYSNARAPLPPPRGDAPDDTAGGSSRDGGYCNQDAVIDGERGFTVLMPTYTETNTERPTFSLYIPDTDAKTVFFTLKDTNEDYYYQTIISLPSTSGEYKFRLPADAPPIEMNKEYTWSVGLICQQAFDPSDPFVTGVIRRVGQNQITDKSEF